MRWMVCLATPYAVAMAGMDGSFSPGPHSPRWMRTRSWAAICRCGASAAPGIDAELLHDDYLAS